MNLLKSITTIAPIILKACKPTGTAKVVMVALQIFNKLRRKK